MSTYSATQLVLNAVSGVLSEHSYELPHRYGGGWIANYAAIGSVSVSRTPVFKLGGIHIY